MSLPATEMLVSTLYTKAIRITSIRNMAANVKTETIDDDEINISAIKKDNKVFNLTDKFDWVDTDEKFPLVIDASNCYTAIEFLRGFGDSQSLTEADALELKANELILEINGNSPLEVQGQVTKTAGITDTNPQGTFN